MPTEILPHHKLLLAVCEGRFSAESRVTAETLLLEKTYDRDALLWTALQQRVGVTVFNNLRSWGLDWALPGTTGKTLHTLSVGAQHINLALWVESSTVTANLMSRGVPVALIKGPALEATAYGSPGDRQYGDIDILLPREFLLEAKQVLTDLGYVQGEYRGAGKFKRPTRAQVVRQEMFTHETIPLVKRVADDSMTIEIDVNFEFSWRGHPQQDHHVLVNTGKALETSNLQSSNFGSFPVLGSEYALLGICSHLMNEATLFAFSGQDWSTHMHDHLLARNLDIFYFISRQPISWDVLDSITKEPGARQALMYGIQTTKLVFPSLCVPEEYITENCEGINKFVMPNGMVGIWPKNYLERLLDPAWRAREALTQIKDSER